MICMKLMLPGMHENLMLCMKKDVCYSMKGFDMICMMVGVV